jgi:hypothetical protein
MARTKATRDSVMANSKALADALDAWLAEADEETVEAALRTFSKNHGTGPANKYSPRNACLIAMQDEDATDVRGNLDWLDAGRRLAAYDESQRITVVQFRGDGKTKAEREEAAARKQDGEISSDDLRSRNFYTLTTVYDARHTEAVLCRACNHPIHRTGFDPKNKRFHTWTHDAGKADHEALPVKREKDEKKEVVAAA